MTRMPISQEIWDMKYRVKDATGRPTEMRVEETWARVARALASVEAPSDRARWTARFEDAMSDFRFLPAGRILAGAGTGRRVTLFNCFVMGQIPDDMGGIFDHLREAALTMQQGGGIGYDFSSLRPKGAPVRGVGADASGPLSFMTVWDAMCRTIMSAGARRGAMMATLSCDHPDIEAFIDAKADAAALRMFNLSVLVTDAFMAAVEAGDPWPLRFGGTVFRTVDARALWDRIMRATYDYAEPGVIFIDRVNARNNLHYCESIQATNPCGEQPLPPYGACLLGSINLARLVRDPFGPGAALDTAALEALVPVAVRMMDNVVDVSSYPLEAQAAEARAKRRIGLGITGLADALIQCRVRYDSEEAVRLTREWLGSLRDCAYRASIDLARERGAFPLFDRDAYLAGETIRGLPEAIRTGLAAHGIRNALVTSIAPTGTISLFAENASSGIEPVFSFTYQRSILNPDGSRTMAPVEDYAYRLFRDRFGPDTPLPDYFVSAQTISPEDHVAIQAAAQDYIDSAISKTINVPADIGFEAFKSVYARAYAMGCKGCTTYRPNEVTGSVLSLETDDPAAGSVPGDAGEASGASQDEATPSRALTVTGDAERALAVADGAPPAARPAVLEGSTYKIRWPDSDHAIYITLNDIERDGRREPFEIFINSKNMEHFAWTVGLTRMISAVFRRGGDISFVVEELQAVFDPRGGQWMNGRYVPSLLAAIGDVIESHLKAIGWLPEDTSIALGSETGPEGASLPLGVGDETGGSPARLSGPSLQSLPGARLCPRCSQPALIRREGCDACQNCGYSKCG
ncbi:MAG: adenosylcobalamin-dependent ribonucleoside-diphosphate reductase [Alphaproteobacteria bacterium]